MVKIGIEVANDISINEMNNLMEELDEVIRDNKSLIRDVKVAGGTNYLVEAWKKTEEE